MRVNGASRTWHSMEFTNRNFVYAGVTGWDAFEPTLTKAEEADDIAVCSASSGLLQVLFGNGDETFQPPVTFPIPGLVPVPGGANSVVQISAADLNNDQKPDLAAATGNGVAIFLNDGTGNFSFA